MNMRNCRSEVELAVLDGDGVGVDRPDQLGEGVDLGLVDESKAALGVRPGLAELCVEL